MRFQPYGASPRPSRSAALLLVAPVVALLGDPAAGQELQAFYCMVSDGSLVVQNFVVPQGISALQVVGQGAHGGNPGKGAAGGYGGYVQATFAVSSAGFLKPGQTLDVYVGCSLEPPVGYGNGGAKGVANSPFAGDGGSGGGGSAILIETPQTRTELIVAAAVGAAAVRAAARRRGRKRRCPQPGASGRGGTGGDGGCANCDGPIGIGGLDGGGTSAATIAGGGAAAIPAAAVARVEARTAAEGRRRRLVLCDPVGRIRLPDDEPASAARHDRVLVGRRRPGRGPERHPRHARPVQGVRPAADARPWPVRHARPERPRRGRLHHHRPHRQDRRQCEIARRVRETGRAALGTTSTSASSSPRPRRRRFRRCAAEGQGAAHLRPTIGRERRSPPPPSDGQPSRVARSPARHAPAGRPAAGWRTSRCSRPRGSCG